MPFIRSLALAEMAVKYTEQFMFYGAENKPLDAVHNIMRRRVPPYTLTDYRIRMNQMHPNYDVLADDPRSNNGLFYLHAHDARHSGMGQCGEQGAIAFDYLTRLKNEKGVAMFYICPCTPSLFSHVFVVLGLPREPARSMVFSEHHIPCGWETAVVCDPWNHDWFDVRVDWSRGMRNMIRAQPHQAEIEDTALWLICVAYFDDSPTAGTLV